MTTALALASALVPPLLAGYLLAGALATGPGSARPAPMLRLGLSLGWATGASSCFLFAWLVLAGRPGPGFFAADLTLSAAAGAAGVAWRRGRAATGAREDLPGPLRVALRIVLALALTAGVALFVAVTLNTPDGQWDAIQVWNLRARFLYRGGDAWAEAFHPRLIATHLDYPLLVPLSVARCWSYAGGDPKAAPIALALAFTLATCGLLAAGLAALRGRAQGLLGGLVLVSSHEFFEAGSHQFADVPLAYFLLATVVALALGDRPGADRLRWRVAAGMMAGFAAWTKNEGLLFLAVVVAARVGPFLLRPRGRDLAASLRGAAAFALGLAPALAALIYFKARFAPTSDLVAGQGLRLILAKLADRSRYALTAREMTREILSWGGSLVLGLVVYRLLLGRAPRRDDAPGTGFATAVPALMLAAYFAVFLITPRYLPWHLQWSLMRLMVQLWPPAVFAFFLATASPAEALARSRAPREAPAAGPA